MKVKEMAQELAWKVVGALKRIDPYGYADDFDDDDERAYEYVLADLMAGGRGTIEYLIETIDDLMERMAS